MTKMLSKAEKILLVRAIKREGLQNPVLIWKYKLHLLNGGLNKESSANKKYLFGNQ
jgi:hypothetical protein